MEQDHNVSRWYPLGDRVIVEPLRPEDVTATGLHIPDTAQETPTQGRIVALPSYPTDGNEMRSLRLGDLVLYTRFSGTEITVDGHTLLVLRLGDLVAIHGRREVGGYAEGASQV